jgi:NADH-quinone oxidoreductase subunit N
VAATGGNWLTIAGIVMLIAGLGFKAALVPFHMWVPDVYQGAPTPITAFMAVGPKAAAFALMLRVFAEGFGDPELARVWTVALWAVAVATMTLGNVVALRQTHIKRMLAYSSIAHAGYLLVAVVAASATPEAYQSAVFYVVVYGLMNLGAFGVVILSTDDSEGDPEIEGLAGLGERQPLAALAMAAFMFSLAGVPPLAGFVGKLLVFRDAIQAGFVGLVIIAVLNSVVSAYYYLRVVVVMYMRPVPEAAKRPSTPVGAVFTVALCAIGVVLLGLRPDWIVRWLMR